MEAAQDCSNAALVVPEISTCGQGPPGTHRDGMREIRAMIVAALPCPPMPVMASREVEDEPGCYEGKCCSSHDLLAHLMNIACTAATEKQNCTRALLQAGIQEEMFSKVDEWKAGNDASVHAMLPPAEWSYQLMGDFTRKYVQSYMADPARAQDVRLLPMSDINRTHPVHIRALEFQKAQDLLYGKCAMITRDYERMSYAELVQVSVARIIESE
jgi:hypothetical protein